MLPAEHRLTHPADFRRVIKRGQRAGSRTLVAHVAYAVPADAPGPPTRVGLVVSKAVGNAVVRNRVKRRLRHAMRDHVATCSAGADIVLRATPAAGRATYPDLAADLSRVLTKAVASTGTGR